MKKAFKYIITLFFLIMVLSLSGCVTKIEQFKMYDDVENINSIEFYYLYSGDSIVDIDNSSYPIKTLDSDLYYDIASDLEELVYKDVIPLFIPSDPNFDLFGYIIKIEYNSGVYQLVSNSGCLYTYNSEKCIDTLVGTTNDEAWLKIIIKYVNPSVTLEPPFTDIN